MPDTTKNKFSPSNDEARPIDNVGESYSYMSMVVPIHDSPTTQADIDTRLEEELVLHFGGCMVNSCDTVFHTAKDDKIISNDCLKYTCLVESTEEAKEDFIQIARDFGAELNVESVLVFDSYTGTAEFVRV